MIARYSPKAVNFVPLFLRAALALGTAGCFFDPRGSVDEFTSVVDSDHATDRALSSAARGDYATAESYALAALRRDPKDPYALLVAGMSYQHMGKYDLARQYYDVILANRPTAMLAVPDATGTVVQRPVLELARANVDTLDKLTGAKLARTIADSGAGPGAGLHPLPLTNAEASVTGRFRILKRLLDEDLITTDEYNARRTANLGALMPIAAQPPSSGLERPIPPDGQIVDRLRALKAAIEAREMLPREAAGERVIILDALLPATPKTRALPPLPPKDLLEAADAVGRVERLQTQGLLGADEVDKEKAALNQALQAQLGAVPVAGTATGLKYGPLPDAAPKPTPATAPKADADKTAKIGNWGVGLGSAPSEAEAKALAEQIKAKFPEELGARDLTVRTITLKGKDVWQVVSAVPGRTQAQHLCKLLKLHRQGCDPVGM